MKKALFLSIIALVIMTISCRRVIEYYHNHHPHGDGNDIEHVEIDSVQVNFPAGSINSDTATLIKVSDPELQYDFDETLELFSVQTFSPNQIILNIGKNPPLNDSILVTIELPAGKIPSNYAWQLFAKVYQDGGEEILDLFDFIPSLYNSSGTALSAMVPAYAFTNKRRADSTYEAIFQLATIPGAPKTTFRTFSLAAADACLAAQIGCPLGGFDMCTDKVTSPYGVRTHPVTGVKSKMHWGVDFGVSTGTSIYAAADGVVTKVRTQTKNNKVTGYGLYIVVKHTDGSSTLYGHLQNAAVSLGQAVKAGQVIATSDNTGASTGPHLHFEYVPNGEIINNQGRIDPFPCISENASGSITVRDNGNLADDAFEVYLDDILIGKTDIGASNSIALNNIVPGNKTLKLLCTIAPDNVGTYEVVLNDGLTFVEDGSTYRSGTLTQGGSTSWLINVPAQSKPSVNRNQSKPNQYIEH